MAEYIEREAVLAKAQLACVIALLDEDPEQCDVDFSDEFAVSVDDIVEIPAADVAPAEQEWTVNDMRQIDMDISVMRPCSKCGEVKEVCCLIDGEPWCEDCFDKALGGE